jgi:hypothetical protein
MLCGIPFIFVGGSDFGCSVDVLEGSIYWLGERAWHAVVRSPAGLVTDCLGSVFQGDNEAYLMSRRVV